MSTAEIQGGLIDALLADVGTVYEALDEDGNVADRLTARAMHAETSVLANRLLEAASPGSRVIIPTQPGLGFERSFFATVMAGMIAVPLPKLGRLASRKLDRAQAVVADCGAEVVIGPMEEISDAAAMMGLRPVGTDNLGTGTPLEALVPPPASGVALLQYTSGSTGTPKGVEITQSNLMANQQAMAERCQVGPGTDIVSWLPTYHDMGLCSMVILPLVSGARLVKMQTDFFIRRPLSWLEAVSGRPEVWTAAPDFAYRTLLDAFARSPLESLDLSGWKIAANASEPVREETMLAFERVFGKFGFASTTFHPGYGLAESTVCVSVNAPGTHRTVNVLERAALAQGVVRDAQGAGESVTVAGCGQPIRGSIVRILHPESNEVLDDCRVGEIAVSSSSNGRGYWNRPELSEQVFGVEVNGTTFLRTGDLGYLRDGEVFICGRKKDLIIVGGENYYSSDLEAAAAEAVADVKRSPLAAFQREDSSVVVAFEANHRLEADQLSDTCREVVKAVASAIPTRVQAVALRRGSIPRTTSGKVQRLKCKDLLADGAFRVLMTWPEEKKLHERV
ncbi:fatty acyl-AMP ligase [Kocuria rhizophila]|uniref:fatty acyl-AMP ligase n=1 Tax=Kocuria rhizophila TaxID=72000 RepID=UPI0011A56F30|nr:fatty acyl-AMP ligase [Kocuria rhizophila]